jgi:serine phosphatase RsbU (regulator of sigma subunit)/pSer/pThr/pTyr-binding forkhead associated (FHA) protein
MTAILRDVKDDHRCPLSAKITLIGRDPVCDLLLRSPQASRRHAMIIFSGGIYYLEDLDSTSGTFLNGQRIVHRRRLTAGDQIELAGLTLQFQDTLTESHPSGISALADTPTIMSSLDLAEEQRVEVAPEAKLRAVLEIARHLSDALDLEVVLPKILESLLTIFPQADRGFILLRDLDTGQLAPKAIRHRRGPANKPLSFSQTIIDHALRTGRAILSADAGHDERFDISQSIQRLKIRSILCVPMIAQDGAQLGLVQIDTQDGAQPFQPEDLDVLVSASILAARAIDLARVHQERRDLEAATQIQASFLPHERPRLEQLEFFDYYSPAKHIGGDYYDYIMLPGNRLAVALGDVSGKGIPAALLMARLSAAVRFCLASEAQVCEAVRQLNRVLTRPGSADRFITFVVAVVDLSTFALTLVNAGHMPPLLRRAGHTKVEDLGDPIVGLPLGVVDHPYEEMVLQLEPGDAVVLYTDGVSEARNPKGDLYGTERLRAVVGSSPADMSSLGTKLLADVRQFAGNRAQSDDLTLVCFRRR